MYNDKKTTGLRFERVRTVLRLLLNAEMQMIHTVWKCAVHIGVYELGVVGVVLCKWFDDGFHLHSPTSLH
jgi:hypothetical protein